MAVVENLTASKAAIRDVTPGDIEAIRAIYGWHVEHGRASFEETTPTLAEMTARVTTVTDQSLPWLVAELDGIVVGYSYASPWRPRPAYRYTLEESIYIDASHGRARYRQPSVAGAYRALRARPVAADDGGHWRWRK